MQALLGCCRDSTLAVAAYTPGRGYHVPRCRECALGLTADLLCVVVKKL